MQQTLHQFENCTIFWSNDICSADAGFGKRIRDDDWVPDLEPILGSRYLAFVLALDADIGAGRVKPGMRLLPQRDMAQRLGLSVGTVSKAYAEAEQRGLISGEVGRGTFVQRRRPEQRTALGTSEATINLALNVPPYTGEDDVIASTISDIVATGEMFSDMARLSAAPGPSPAPRRHRRLARIARRDLRCRADFHHTWRPARALHRARLAIDGEGLVPESLDLAFTETGARVLYCMPTLQTPTGAIMSPARRQAIAAIVRKHDAHLVEDDAYAYLLTPPLPPVSCLIPERSFYVMSFAKCLAPGLRIAAMIAPDLFRDRAINAVRATGWMAVPLMAEVVARLITSGDLARQARMKRDKAALRNAIVRRVLKEWLPPSDFSPRLSHLAAAARGPHDERIGYTGRAGRHHAGASRLTAAHADRTAGKFRAAVPRRTGDRRKPGAGTDRDQAHPGNG